MQRHGFRRHSLGSHSTTRIDVVAATFRGFDTPDVLIFVVKGSPTFQRFEEHLAIFLSDGLIQFVLRGAPGKKFGNMPIEISLDLAKPSWFAAKGTTTMDIRVVIEVVEGFNGHIKAFAVIQYGSMVIRQTPGPWIKVKPAIKLAPLSVAAQFVQNVSTPDRPITASGPILILKKLHLVTGVAQFKCRYGPDTPAPSIRTVAPFGSPESFIRPV